MSKVYLFDAMAKGFKQGDMVGTKLGIIIVLNAASKDAAKTIAQKNYPSAYINRGSAYANRDAADKAANYWAKLDGLTPVTIDVQIQESIGKLLGL